MKSIFESGEVMAAYADIDLCYHGLRMLHEKQHKPTTPIERMIDAATGADKANLKADKNTAISLFKRIIKNKKFIEADYSNDQKALEALKKL